LFARNSGSGGVAAVERPSSLEALCAHMTANGVSREWLPERLILLDEMPRSTGEKIDKRRLRELVTPGS